jgi:hypothetical protein
LAAGAHGVTQAGRSLTDEQESDSGGWLLQSLKKGILGFIGERVRRVNDEDTLLSFVGLQDSCGFDATNGADSNGAAAAVVVVANAADTAGRYDLYVGVLSTSDAVTWSAVAARTGFAIRGFAVERAGKGERERAFANVGGSGEQDRVRQAVG